MDNRLSLWCAPKELGAKAGLIQETLIVDLISTRAGKSTDKTLPFDFRTTIST
jgi:hypothetical protein